MSSFIILSFGRSGSVLLAHNVGRSVGSLPTYADYLSDLGSAVVHTHLKLPAECFAGYQRIFNLRANPVETVLSGCMSKHYDQYHKFKDRDRPSLSPFYLDPSTVVKTCQGLIDWHDYYDPQLANNDLVIIYEHMIDMMTNPVYDRIYPDKQQLILNYHEAVSICQEYRAQMQASIAKFLQHKNQQDITALVNYAG